MKKPFRALLALAAIIIFLGIVGYSNFYKPERVPIKTTAVTGPVQKTNANPNDISGINDKEAIEKVRQLPEVKNFLARVANPNFEVSF